VEVPNGSLETIGFAWLDSDWGLYYWSSDRTMVLLSVNDVLVASPSYRPSIVSGKPSLPNRNGLTLKKLAIFWV